MTQIAGDLRQTILGKSYEFQHIRPKRGCKDYCAKFPIPLNTGSGVATVTPV
jgi:hypothetical protein